MNKAIILVIALISLSCASTKKDTKTVNNPLQNSWELTKFKGKDVNSDNSIYLEFSEDGRVSGNVGCNRLTGNYSIENTQNIQFSELATTRKACPDMDIESDVLEALNSTSSFNLITDELVLNTKSVPSLAVFKRMKNTDVVNKYWKLITLDGKKITMDEDQEREQYFILKNNGLVTGFAGCNQFNGEFTIKDGNRIKFGDNMSVTLKSCLNTDVDEQGFLEVFELTNNYTVDGDRLSLNVGKRAPLATFEAVYF